MNGEGSNTFGERLRSMRQERGMTQKDLASLVGLSQTAIHKLETGRSEGPTAKHLENIGKTFQCSMDFLWTGQEGETVVMAKMEPWPVEIRALALTIMDGHRLFQEHLARLKKESG